jgi:hypothetical protein
VDAIIEKRHTGLVVAMQQSNRHLNATHLSRATIMQEFSLYPSKT